ncbi:hypothetical protein L218DRAFT_1061891 [Marasmius fiardii PR-910]|nr:hypothetical protein L218DRAFT_1061891 [Marasmius fiardii PR-910]
MSGVAAHIPLALSLLQTVASQYPGLQKGQPMTNVAPGASAGSSLLATALSRLPTFQSGSSQSQPQSSSQGTTSTASSVASTPPATSYSNLCESCHFKQKYNDGQNTHPYCSKSCAKAKAGGTPSNSNCDLCHSRPKYAGHPFCSKSCARNASAANGQGGISGNPPGMCQGPGCQKSAHNNADYCSLSHKTLAETICLMCLQQSKRPHSNFCGTKCEDDAEKRGPMILEVPADM